MVAYQVPVHWHFGQMPVSCVCSLGMLSGYALWICSSGMFSVYDLCACSLDRLSGYAPRVCSVLATGNKRHISGQRDMRAFHSEFTEPERASERKQTARGLPALALFDTVSTSSLQLSEFRVWIRSKSFPITFNHFKSSRIQWLEPQPATVFVVTNSVTRWFCSSWSPSSFFDCSNSKSDFFWFPLWFLLWFLLWFPFQTARTLSIALSLCTESPDKLQNLKESLRNTLSERIS